MHRSAREWRRVLARRPGLVQAKPPPKGAGMGVFGGRYGERSHEQVARLEADLAAARRRIEELKRERNRFYTAMLSAKGWLDMGEVYMALTILEEMLDSHDLLPEEKAKADLAAARIAELEAERNGLAFDLAVLDAPDRADNIATRNMALAEAETARQRIEELETLGKEIVVLWQANACAGGSRYHQLHSKIFDLSRLLRMGGS